MPVIIGAGRPEITTGTAPKAGIEHTSSGLWAIRPNAEKDIQVRFFKTPEEARANLETQRALLKEHGFEAWQLNRSEFFQRGEEPITAKLKHSTITLRREITPKVKVKRGKAVDVSEVAFIQVGTGTRLNGDFIHRQAVEQAISEDKPVPQEVLADYPEFKPSAFPEHKSFRIKLTPGISQRAAESRFMNPQAGTTQGKTRRPKVDKQFTADTVAPATPKTEKDVQLQRRWFKHPNRLDFEGVDTGTKSKPRTFKARM